MVRNHRSVIASAVAIASIAGGIGYGLAEQDRYSDDAYQQVTDYAKDAANQIAQSCRAKVVVEQPKCLREKANLYRLDGRDKQREYEDLVSQRKSALWAMIMGVAALAGMALSVVGVVLVWTTFNETRRANEIAKLQNRPFMVPVNISIKYIIEKDNICDGFSGGISASFKIKNVGNSIGFLEKLEASIHPSDNKNFSVEFNPVISYGLVPNQKGKAKHRFGGGSGNRSDLDDFFSTDGLKLPCYFHGYIQYRDVFGVRRRSHFHYVTNVDDKGINLKPMFGKKSWQDYEFIETENYLQ